MLAGIAQPDDGLLPMPAPAALVPVVVIVVAVPATGYVVVAPTFANVVPPSPVVVLVPVAMMAADPDITAAWSGVFLDHRRRRLARAVADDDHGRVRRWRRPQEQQQPQKTTHERLAVQHVSRKSRIRAPYQRRQSVSVVRCASRPLLRRSCDETLAMRGCTARAARPRWPTFGGAPRGAPDLGGH